MQFPIPNYNTLEQVNIDYARKHNYTGIGVGVAVLDSGIGPHVDFNRWGNRVIAFKDFVNNRMDAYDDSSHGSHVCGLIGSSGRNVRNQIIGVAPECYFIIGKVLDARGNGKVNNVIDGLRWVVAHKDEYRIRIVNISVGTPVSQMQDENSLLIQEVNKVWDAGLVVVVAAGNNGPNNMSITTPGISRKVITVGSYDQDASIPDAEKAATYSGRGPTISCVKKPDLVAPGSNIISCNNTRKGYCIKSGTSMSTPIVSGAISLLIQKNPWMTNKDVKMKLWTSTNNLGLDWKIQGYGMLDIKKMLS